MSGALSGSPIAWQGSRHLGQPLLLGTLVESWVGSQNWSSWDADFTDGDLTDYSTVLTCVVHFLTGMKCSKSVFLF